MNDIDDILKNKLENFRELPSSEVFNTIRKNYPKRSFIEVIKYNKYYFIATMTALLLTAIIISISNSKSNQKNGISTINNNNGVETNNNNSVVYNTNTIDSRLNTIENSSYKKDILPGVVESEVNTAEMSYKDAEVFFSRDTVICGGKYETMIIGSADNLILPIGIYVTNINDRTVFSCNKSGRYIIKYAEKSDNIVLRDSMIITYRNSGYAEVNFSKLVLCPGEDLLVSLKDNSYISEWGVKDYKISKLSGNNYSISGLKPGLNAIKFDLSDGECSSKYEKSVQVINPLEYRLLTTPSICSESNATLSVIAESNIPSEFTLNNEYSSNNGVFKNLDPGIYSLSIKYGSDCQIYDTLLIRDSLNISPYFISERDLINKNKYSFRNLTKVDDRGYERNSSVSFVWKINGEELIQGDNPVYEFTKDGDNIVELIAVLNESCQSIYSETIHVSISNFKIPNIFTPNGDGIGDEFKVVYEGEIKNYRMTIMSRMGEIAYESNNISDSWNGKINGNDDAAEGLYYYIIRGEDKFGKIIEKKGALQLVRH